MEQGSLVSIIGGIMVLSIFLIAIVIRFKSKPTTYDKEKAKEFLEGLSDAFYNEVIAIISNINPKNFSSLEEFEVFVLNEIYDAIWNYVEEKLASEAKNDILTTMVLKVLDKDFVIEFIDSVYDRIIHDNVNSLWSQALLSNSEELIKEDKEHQEKFSGDEYIEESNSEDLKSGEIELTEEEQAEKDAAIAALNPQTDDEEEYDEDDSSVEVIGEEDEDTYIDAQGRKRSRSTGRYV